METKRGVSFKFFEAKFFGIGLQLEGVHVCELEVALLGSKGDFPEHRALFVQGETGAVILFEKLHLAKLVWIALADCGHGNRVESWQFGGHVSRAE